MLNLVGVGKMKHLQVQRMWAQHTTRGMEVHTEAVDPSDMMFMHLVRVGLQTGSDKRRYLLE